MKDQTKSYIYAGTAIFFWSTVASAFKIGLRYLDFIQFLFIATLTSFSILLIISLFQRNIRSVFSYSLKDYLRSACLGLLNPFLYYLVLFKAYSLLPAQVAQPLNMIWPIVLVFLSIPLLKQRISYRSFIALTICFAGVYLISSQGNPSRFSIEEPFGVSLAIVSSLIWSLFWIYNVKDNRNETLKLLLNFLFAGIYITITLIFFSDARSLPLPGLGMAVYTGVFEMGITFVLWLKALTLTKTTDKISSLVYLAPFLSLFFIHIFVGESIYITTIGGLILIVTGIIIEKNPFSIKKYYINNE